MTLDKYTNKKKSLVPFLRKVGTLINENIEKSKLPFFRAQNEGVKFIG